MIKYEEQIPLHHLVTVLEGRIADGWKPIALFIETNMYTIVFRKDEK
jgi:hypothetical protein